MTTALLQKLSPLPNNIMETERVDRMGNETEENKMEGLNNEGREIERVDSETEGMGSDNEGVHN